MKVNDVPQEESILAGHRRACYAVDDQGRYRIVPSKGWEVERIVNMQAHDEIRRAADAVYRRVLAGKASPLAYHMVVRQMTPRLLAAYAGFWSLRVRWHLRPRVFARLKPGLYARYARALGIDVEALRTVPAEAPAESTR